MHERTFGMNTLGVVVSLYMCVVEQVCSMAELVKVKLLYTETMIREHAYVHGFGEYHESPLYILNILGFTAILLQLNHFASAVYVKFSAAAAPAFVGWIHSVPN